MGRPAQLAAWSVLVCLALLSSGCATPASRNLPASAVPGSTQSGGGSPGSPAPVSAASGRGGLPGSAAPVVKLGVIAPFEGAGRSLGYAVLPVIQATVAEANRSGALGPYRVLVVAFNDNLDPVTAALQAHALALDPDVMAVIGPFTGPTSEAAGPVLLAAGLAGLPFLSPDPRAAGHGDEIAVAEAATGAALDALAAEIQASGRPIRSGVAARLLQVTTNAAP